MNFWRIGLQGCGLLLGVWLPLAGCVTVDAPALIKQGEVHKAEDQCQRKTGPERRDCFTLVSDAYLMHLATG